MTIERGAGRTALAACCQVVVLMLALATQGTRADESKRVGMQIDYVEFKATDMEQTKTFYKTVFGWKFTDYGPDYTSFADGRINGGFTKSDAVVPGGPLVVLLTTDLEAAQASVKEHGGKIVKPIFSFPGGRRFQFTDPSGNELAVWSAD